MKRTNIFILILLAVFIFFGNKFREKDYATVPFPGEDADEYSFGWLGLSLIKDHCPIAWSGIAGYKEHDFQKINVDKLFDNDPQKGPFPINKPWFDHPPLMGLVVGGYAYTKGIRNFEDASVIVLRRPMLKISILVTVLIFILGTQLFGKWVGLISSGLYTIIPTMAIAPRLAIAENGLIPIFLLAFIFAHEYFKKKKIVYWNLASIIGFLAPLIKLSGLSVPLALIVLALTFGEKKKWKLALVPLASGVLGIAAFCLYGAYFGWETFVNVFRANSNRFFGASSEIFYTVLTNTKITRNYTDGWMTASIISFFIAVFSGFQNNKGVKFLSIGFFSYLFFFLLFGSESYGFYRFPFYPFTIISFAYVISEIFRSSNILVGSILSLLPLGTGIHRIVGVVGFQDLVPYFRIGVIIFFVVFVFSLILKKSRAEVLQKGYLIALFSLMVYWAIKEIYFIDIDKWYWVN